MPIIDLDKEPERLYYPIGEVASMFGVNTSLIRFWEKEFEVLKPKKNKKGNRLFSPEDVENIRLIFHLVKEKGYTLEGAKKILEEKRGKFRDIITVRESLQNLRSFLKRLHDEL